MTHDEARAALDAQFERGPLPAASAAVLRTHLRDCDPCRAHYERLVDLERGLSGGAVVPPALLSRALAAGPPRVPAHVLRGPASWWLGSALLAAAAIVAAFVLWPPAEDAPAIRGGATTGRTAWVNVFVRRGEAVRPLGDRLDAGDGLLFAYTALKSTDARHLAIAGRDAAGRVHWYHPAWTSSAEDPMSLRVAPGSADVQLPEVLYAEHAPGPLEICALFTPRPLRLRSVDADVGAGRWPAEGTRDCRTVVVEP